MTLPIARIQSLVAPCLALPDEKPASEKADEFPEALLLKLSALLDLLIRWNAATNLTAIRDPEQIVQRHFGESLFVAKHLQRIVPAGGSILDFGSGAGFPGIPIQLFCPELLVTLAESQGKKVSFLREASRVLDLHCDIWDGRVENLPDSRRFDAVTLRAVDNWRDAVEQAKGRVENGGTLALIVGGGTPAFKTDAFALNERVRIPESDDRWLELWVRHVPRGTSF